MPTDLLIKWPSRSRPALVSKNLHLWNVPGVRFVFSLDADDKELPKYWATLDGLPNVKICVGSSANKVAAVNRDLAGEDFCYLILASDDMVPQTPAWAERIRELMWQHFPNGDGVLHLNDGRVGRKLNTLCICDKRYYDRFGYLYHPDYTSLHCDDEWQAVSEKLNRAVYVDEVLIRHEWTDATGRDPLHLRNESFYGADGHVFEKRKKAGFP